VGVLHIENHCQAAERGPSCNVTMKLDLQEAVMRTG
jgi:hypothetical protein